MDDRGGVGGEPPGEDGESREPALQNALYFFIKGT